MDFDNAFDMAYPINFGPESITKLKIPIDMITDSLSLFYIVTKETSTTEKMLNIDL